VNFGGTAGKEVVIFFSTKLYKDHIESYLSELSYSELVQGQLEKMAFSLVDPLPEWSSSYSPYTHLQ
jgi:hypothetical protein